MKIKILILSIIPLLLFFDNYFLTEIKRGFIKSFADELVDILPNKKNYLKNNSSGTLYCYSLKPKINEPNASLKMLGLKVSGESIQEVNLYVSAYRSGFDKNSN